MQTFKLRSGEEIPAIGFGTWKLADGSEAVRSVQHALESGYRLIDTAAHYGNEASIGKAVNKAEFGRSEVWVTTKLWSDDLGYDSALEACDASLERLGLDYVDVYLIHWPANQRRRDAWKALVELKKTGKARHIGVSNFTPQHLEELKTVSEVVPEVNQIELHPFIYQEQKDIVEYCREHQIMVQSYSPLGSGELLDNKILEQIAASYNKTPAQVLIRWALHHETIPLPRSSNPQRIAENIDVFDFQLYEEDMRRLDTVNKTHRTVTDPHVIP